MGRSSRDAEHTVVCGCVPEFDFRTAPSRFREARHHENRMVIVTADDCLRVVDWEDHEPRMQRLLRRRPATTRAVGLANGANPIAIVIPCHRVIGANPSLTGYGGGLDRKRWLLAHESACSASYAAQFHPGQVP